MSDRAAAVPILVVGAGPAGLMTSFLLTRYGVRSVVIDRQPGISPLPRALGINPRSMEIFRSLGLEEEIMAGSVDVRGLPFLVVLDTLRGPLRSTHPFPRGWSSDDPASPTPARLALFTQLDLERLLERKLEESGLAEIRRSARLTALEHDGTGVTARFTDRSTGGEHVVRADYVVAADGAYSTVRELLGISMRGHDHLTHELNILLDADLRKELGDVHSVLYQVRHPWKEGACLFRPVDGRRRWSAVATWFEDPSPERCAEFVRLCAADADLDVRIVAVGDFERATLLADRFRNDRVFLVGDAAHRVTPTGAFGMNTALQDAHNLAWKLAAVIRGWAGPGVLATYESERRPWTQTTVEMSFRLHQQPWGGAANTVGHVLGAAYEAGAFVPDRTPPPAVADPVAEYVPSARPGRRAPHCWITLNGRRISTLDLFSGRFVLLSSTESWSAAARDMGPTAGLPLDAYVVTDRIWAELYEVGASGAVLVRPDGHVAWRTRSMSSNPRADLRDALDSVLDLRGMTQPIPAVPTTKTDREPAKRRLDTLDIAEPTPAPPRT